MEFDILVAIKMFSNTGFSVVENGIQICLEINIQQLIRALTIGIMSLIS